MDLISLHMTEISLQVTGRQVQNMLAAIQQCVLVDDDAQQALLMHSDWLSDDKWAPHQGLMSACSITHYVF